MASKRINLNKRSLFVLSGVSNVLGRIMGVEMCGRLKPGSVAVVIGSTEEDLQAAKKEIQYLGNGVEVVCCVIADSQPADVRMYSDMLATALAPFETSKCCFELAFILHNEGTGATRKLMEPQDAPSWQAYIEQNLYAPLALNQAFLQADHAVGVEKLIVNITSSLLVKPFLYNSLACSCKKARDMYFRSMAAEETRYSVAVISYSPGILASHEFESDMNNNMVDLPDLNIDEKLLQAPRVEPMQSTLKLINILQEVSFISGHDVDYYDTFVL